MRSYSVAEAKAHFDEMLDRVREGEIVELTEGGKAVAKVSAASPASEQKNEAAGDLVAIRALFKGVSLEDMKSARDEGHRY